MSSDDASFPAWDAIKEAIRRVYGDREEKYYGSMIPSYLGGGPLDAISAFKNAGPIPHWHLIGQGLTDLFGRQEEPGEISGAGFELTFRVTCDPGEEEPPNWAMNFLQNVASVVREYGDSFDPYHTIDANGPISLEIPTELSAAAFILDPQLREIDTPNGHVKFLQLVGISADELAASLEWRCQGIIEMLATASPLLITDLLRQSVLKDPRTRDLVQRRMAREGAASGNLSIDGLRWKQMLLKNKVELTIGAMVVPSLVRKLRGRLPHGRDVNLSTERDPARASFSVGDHPAWSVHGPELRVVSSPDLARRMIDQLKPRRGRYEWPDLPGFSIVIEPTEIRDPDGKVVEVIG